MINENSQAELMLLQKEQKALQNEVFGGLSKAERAEFDRRAERIRALRKRTSNVRVFRGLVSSLLWQAGQWVHRGVSALSAPQ